MDPYYREPTSSATAQRLNAVGPEALSQKAVRLTGDNPKKCGGRRSSIREVVATDGPPLRSQICFLFNKAQKTLETYHPKAIYLREPGAAV
jgi:hypothetical protein